MSDKPRRKITVLGLDIEFQGRSKSTGNEFTIYNVTALGEDGLPIELRLRTFDKDLPLNELIEVEVEKRDDARHGTTYTVGIPGKRNQEPRRNGLAGSVDELRGRVEALEALVQTLISGGDTSQLQTLATPPPGDAGGGVSF